MAHAIRVIAPNQTELVTTVNAVRRTIFFSYETPVVIRYDYNHGIPKEYKYPKSSEIFVTNKKHSATTSRHINKYLGISPCEADHIRHLGATVESVSQGEIYRLSDVMSREEVRQ